MDYVLALNEEEYDIESSSDLSAHLEEARKHDYMEIWLDQIEGPKLGVMFNRDKAWLIFLEDEEDEGVSSRNPAYVGEPGAEFDFVLSDGQRDVYPLSWCIPTDKAIGALLDFYERGDKPAWIQWE